MYHRLSGLKNRNYFLTVPEAKRQRLRHRHSWFFPRPLSLACRWLPSAHTVTALCAHTCLLSLSFCVLISSSYKDIGQIELSPTPTNYPILNYLTPLKTLSPNISIVRYWLLGLQYTNFREILVSP